LVAKAEADAEGVNDEDAEVEEKGRCDEFP